MEYPNLKRASDGIVPLRALTVTAAPRGVLHPVGSGPLLPSHLDRFVPHPADSPAPMTESLGWETRP